MDVRCHFFSPFDASLRSENIITRVIMYSRSAWAAEIGSGPNCNPKGPLEKAAWEAACAKTFHMVAAARPMVCWF